MLRRIARNKFMVVSLLFLMLVFISSDSFASDRGHYNDRGHYYYRGNHWYRSGSFWGRTIVSGLIAGAIVASLPPRTRTVYVSNAPYYYDGVYYFRPCPGGYVVVEPSFVQPSPVIIQEQPVQIVQSQNTNVVVINIPNIYGGYSPVTLIRQGNGYIGPQGEYYRNNPTVEQLRALYGR